MWGKIVRIWIPFSFANVIDGSEMCELWLSINSNTGLSFEHLVDFTKCFRNSSHSSTLIHPDLEQTPTELAGAPDINATWNLFRENINIGGMLFPKALIAQTRVTNSPRSAATKPPTCFFSFASITRTGSCTVRTSVSSALYISPALKECFVTISAKLS